MIALILIESAITWIQVVAGNREARIHEAPFVATQFAVEQ
jgi:hypothetical protein